MPRNNLNHPAWPRLNRSGILFATPPAPRLSYNHINHCKILLSPLPPHKTPLPQRPPPPRRTLFNRALTHQWFDNWPLTELELKQHMQTQGLRETTTFLHDLLRKEIVDVGPERVVLMGLSQGCAASLVAGMLWKDRVVGMCGYLPFCGSIHEAASVDAEADDTFEHDEEEQESRTGFAKAIKWLGEELGIGVEPAESYPIQSTPVFLAHGKEPEKVPVAIGRVAGDFLKDIEVEAVWKEYEGLGHWYSGDMLRDVVPFLKNLERWRVSI